MKRPDWDEYYLNIAKAVSLRGECKRRRVGAVIVKNHSIVGTGYNGTSPGAKSCLDGACPRAESNVEPNANYAESGCHVIHAETNALMRTPWNDMMGATIYVTDRPCADCWPKIRNTGIIRVVWPGGENVTKYLNPRPETQYVSFSQPIPIPDFPKEPAVGDLFHLEKERLSWDFNGKVLNGPYAWDK